jgi:hypothetical protein
MTTTNFPNGVTSRGVPVERGAPDLVAGSVFFVQSGHTNASNDNSGLSRSAPLATLARAVALATASNGDVIFLLPGHAETYVAAAGVNVNKAGLTIIGVGEGAARPTFTFGTDVAASFRVSAANVKIHNIVGVAGIDALTGPFDIQAADCDLELEWRDGTSAIEAERVVLTTAAADRLKLHLVHRGFTAGDACVNSVRLVGGDGVRVFVDFYGKASTAVVEFATTACTNVFVEGVFYNDGTTDGSKDVVDTITGSTWGAHIFDSTAGSVFSGGSASAFAKDDISAVSDALYGANGVVTWAAGAAPGNGVSISEGLRKVYEEGVLQRESIGEADIDVSEADYTAFIALMTITPAAGAPLFDLKVHFDIAKDVTGLVAGYTTETIQFCVSRKIDGTNWRRDRQSYTTATAANATGFQGVSVDVGYVGVDEEVRIEVLVSAEQADVEMPYAAYYKSFAAATFTPVAAV